MKFSIIIPTYNHLEDCLRPCIESIIKHTDLTDVEIIVVANGCGVDTMMYLKELQRLDLIGISHTNVKMVWMENQAGYTKAVNEGIKIATGEYIIFLNNDTKILDGWPKNSWIDLLVEPFLKDPLMGVTGPMKTLSPSAGREFIIFFCAMTSRKVIDAIGMLDEEFFAYGEDTDFCLRAEDAGFKIKQVPRDSNEYYADKRMIGDFPIWHEGNVSFKNWPGGDELLAKNNEILRQRYNKDSVNIERAKQCDGFMSDEELIWLAKQAKNCHGYFIEIGSWHGKSSRVIADNLPANGKLICVDHWLGSDVERDTHHISASWMNGDHAYIEFCENMVDHIESGKCLPLRMASENAAAFLKKHNIKAEVVFVDAGHTYEESKKDCLLWKSVVKDSGFICGHDYVNGLWPDVTRSVHEVFGQSNTNHIPNTSIWQVFNRLEYRIVINKPKIYDAFPFNNELDILEQRLTSLFETVDRFIIVEAKQTHSGKPKELNFHKNILRFQHFLHKITYIVVEHLPEVDGSVTDKSWARERFQRDEIMKGLTDCRDEDVIIISDCDEIPDVLAIQNFSSDMGIRSFEMELYYYNNKCRSVDKWTEAKILSYKELKELSPCGARYTKCEVIKDGGKHLSYFGGVNSVIEKIESSAHVEYDLAEFKDHDKISKAIETGNDIFGRNLKYELLP